MSPNHLPAIHCVSRPTHCLKKPVAQFNFADQVMRAILARLFRHGIKHVKPGGIVLVLVQRWRQVHDMRIGLARAIAELTNNILVVDVAQ